MRTSTCIIDGSSKSDMKRRSRGLALTVLMSHACDALSDCLNVKVDIKVDARDGGTASTNTVDALVQIATQS